MNKNKSSVYNAISAIMHMAIRGILALITTRIILLKYGSDFNGVNATALQIINMLLILEGGFTLASNVALFKPLSDGNYSDVNSILTATHKKFIEVAAIFIASGLILSLGYTFIIKSDLSRELIFSIFTIMLIAPTIDFIFSLKYKIFLQSMQKEYIINMVSVFSTTIAYTVTIIAVNCNAPMWSVSIIAMLFALLGNIYIGMYCKRKYVFLDFSAKPNFNAIKGSSDVFIAKIGWLVYSSSPMIIISASALDGAKQTSVYAVYNSVFSLIKNSLNAFTTAPRFGFGALIAEGNRDKLYITFKQYELIVLMAISILITTTMVLILPFVELYTHGVNDIAYRNVFFAVMFGITSIIEISHIPSGQIINMSGDFKTAKRYQIIVCCVLLVLLIGGINLGGIYGMMISFLLTAVLSALLETRYTHVLYFKTGISMYIRQFIPNLIFMLIFIPLEMSFLPKISDYLTFLICGIILVICNFILVMFINLIANREVFINIIRKFNYLVKIKL